MKRRSHTILAAALLLAAAAAVLGCAPSIPPQRPVDTERMEKIRAAISEGTGGGVIADEGPEPTGWATLRGTFKFTPADAGKFTERPNLAVDGEDAGFCNRDGAPKSNSLLVKPGGEVQNVVIYLDVNLSKKSKPELWIHESAAPGSNTEPVVFDQRNCVFLSPVTTMQVSQPLNIRNSDRVGHNTNLRNSSPISETIPIGGGITYEHRGEERMPYPVSCNVHPWMKAYILVRSNAYFAQTKEDGSFVIENLPAGVKLNMKVWHESAGFLSADAVNSPSAEWTTKGLTVNLPAGGETSLDVVLHADKFGN